MSEIKKTNHTNGSEHLLAQDPLRIDAYHFTTGRWLPVHVIEPAWLRDTKNNGLMLLGDEELESLERDKDGNIADFEIVPGIVFDGSAPARNGLARVRSLELPDLSAELLVFPNGADRGLDRPMFGQIPYDPDTYAKITSQTA